jgi:hypothetical protein
VIPKISQETLAEMEVHHSLLNVVLHDIPHLRRRAEKDD